MHFINSSKRKFPNSNSLVSKCLNLMPIVSCKFVRLDFTSLSLPPLVLHDILYVTIRTESDFGTRIERSSECERGCFTYSFPRRHNSSLRKRKPYNGPAARGNIKMISQKLLVARILEPRSPTDVIAPNFVIMMN